MTTIERLRALGQRRAEEGIYTDQNICEAAIAEREELVAALKYITECAEAGADGANMDLWVAQSRALLAKLEGK